MWFASLWNLEHQWVQWLVVAGAAVVCALTDLRSRRVLNVVTIPLLLAGFAHAWLAAGWVGVADAFAASVVLAGPYIVLYAAAGGGAGDVKLMAGIGAWLGIMNGLAALFAVGLIGAFLSPLYAWWSTRRSASDRLRGVGEGGPVREAILKAQVPYALTICVGVCVAAQGVLLWSR